MTDKERINRLNELTPEGGELRIVAEDGGIWLEQITDTREFHGALSDPCESLREAIDKAAGISESIPPVEFH